MSNLRKQIMMDLQTHDLFFQLDTALGDSPQLRAVLAGVRAAAETVVL